MQPTPYATSLALVPTVRIGTPMNRRLPQWRPFLALVFGLALILAPTLADARAGGGFFSGGSRGTRSFEPNGAAPLGRTMQTPGVSTPFAPGGGSFFSRHPFMTGLFGGFIGSMLFGGSGGVGHALRFLFEQLISGFLIMLAVRLFTGRGLSMAGGGAPRSLGAAAAPAQQHYRGRDITVGDADLSAFQSLHAAIQEAWGRADLAQMRQLMTPEMISYFSEELTKNASQG